MLYLQYIHWILFIISKCYKNFNSDTNALTGVSEEILGKYLVLNNDNNCENNYAI